MFAEPITSLLFELLLATFFESGVPLSFSIADGVLPILMLCRQGDQKEVQRRGPNECSGSFKSGGNEHAEATHLLCGTVLGHEADDLLQGHEWKWHRFVYPIQIEIARIHSSYEAANDPKFERQVWESGVSRFCTNLISA